jgi:hypothetical protein
MSKNMKTSAFSCGESGVVEQPLGNGVPPFAIAPGIEVEPLDTCISLNTTLPHRSLAALVCGVVNWTTCGRNVLGM